jgi:hypothetical protein
MDALSRARLKVMNAHRHVIEAMQAVQRAALSRPRLSEVERSLRYSCRDERHRLDDIATPDGPLIHGVAIVHQKTRQICDSSSPRTPCKQRKANPQNPLQKNLSR